MKVTVLGLGEAGSILAADLVGAGDEVHAYDPGQVATPPGVVRHPAVEAAVADCQLVMSVTPAASAREVLVGALGTLDDEAVFADLSTASPGAKESLAEAAGRGVLFADVALMAPVPAHGLATPALAAGSGAIRYAELINARGGLVEVVGDRAGQAAARKLLRSVIMKGLAALLIEGTEAATRYGQGEWFWRHMVEQFGSIDEALLERLLFATAPHAERRLEEMEAARDLLTELGVPATMTAATIVHLRRLLDEGMPQVVIEEPSADD